jgi:hypothetical protein
MKSFLLAGPLSLCQRLSKRADTPPALWRRGAFSCEMEIFPNMIGPFMALRLLSGIGFVGENGAFCGTFARDFENSGGILRNRGNATGFSRKFDFAILHLSWGVCGVRGLGLNPN